MPARAFDEHLMPFHHELSATVLTDLLFEEPGLGRCLVAPDGSVLRANAEWLRSTRFTLDEVLGADVIDLFPGTRDMALALHGRARAGHRVEVPRHAQMVNGRETWWEGSIAPVPMEGGNGLLVTVREVTREAPELRRDLARSSRHPDLVTAVLDTVANLVVVLDAEGRIVRFNAACEQATGYTAPEVVGRSVFETLIPADERASVEAVFRRLTAGDYPNRHRNRWRTKDGSERLLDWANTCVVGERGEVEYVVATATDITDRERSQQALRESEERSRRRAAELETVLDAVPAAVFITRDGDAGHMDANRFCLEMLRAPPGANVSKTADLRNRPRNFRAMRDGMEIPGQELPVQRAARGEQVADYEFDLVFDDGEVRRLFGNAAPLRGPDGAPTGAVGAFLDITVRQREIDRRKEMERALQQSEQQLRMATVAANIGVWSWVPGTSEVSVSSNWRQLFGVGPDQQVTFETWRDALHPDDRERAVRELNEAAAGRREFDTEYRVALPDGAVRWIVDRGRASYDADGRAVVMGGVNFDITDRKRTEEELALVTRLYGVLSRVNEAIVRIRDEASLYEEVCRIVAEEGRFPLVWVGLVQGSSVVPAACWGRAADDLRGVAVQTDGESGQGPTGTCVREDRPVIDDAFDANPAAWPWRHDTARRGLRASAAFPLHRDGVVVGALTFYAEKPGAFTTKQVRLMESLCADISYALDAITHERLRTETEQALRNSERALRESDRHKTEFLGVLSHELRNPLAPIRNSIYLLERASPGSEQAARAKEVIKRQIDHLTRLVDDLLDMTRISRGKIELRRQRLDLREVVRKATDDVRALYEQSDIELRVEHAVGPVWVDADPTRLAQVVGNLLQNSLKFTPSGGVVTVRVATDHDAAQLSVTDDGLGIEPRQVNRMFEPFAQADGGIARIKGGLGLGLSLVKGLVELHGGSVRAYSDGIGRGATFTVQLPLSGAGAAGSHEDGAAAPMAPRRILVIEDNLDAGQSMADILELNGHRVRVARDGRSGLALARELRPDVVLCDIGLPDLDGYEVARTLRADEAFRAIRLVAVSGYAQPEDLRRASDAGFDAHIPKPASVSDLLSALGGT